ncbi:glycerol-3-phosphate cytidylyltransferase, partial [Campylobacter coli]|nr:glycerol-3-phosphate cytidylyltransferase [Campylobacter coli]
PNWNIMEEKFKKVNVRVIYFPYTKGTSSTLINETLKNLRQ